MEIDTINRIARKAASAVLQNVEVTRVDSEPTADSYGDDALNVTIIFKGAADHQISGDEAVKTIYRIQRDLTEAGEDRFPIVYFVSEDELELDGSPQSE